MKTKKIWANFSVKDIGRTREFYEQLGCTFYDSGNNPKLAGFNFGENEFVILFFEEGSQIDEYLPPQSKNSGEIMFTLSADTEEEVKKWAQKVKAAGGNIFHDVKRDKTGYYGFAFADPDGHKFNMLLMEEKK